MSQPKPPSFKEGLLIVFVSTVIFSLLLEVTVSSLTLIGVLKPVTFKTMRLKEGQFRYDPATGWRFRPGWGTAHYQAENDSWDIIEVINGNGWRDWDYSVSKPDGIFRIADMGDSFTFGYGVRIKDTYTKVLDKMFKDAGQPEVQVLNFGVNGWGLDQMLLGYKNYVRAYKPDVLLVLLTGDMVLRCEYGITSGAAKPYFVLKDDGSLQLKNYPAPVNFLGPIERWFMRNSTLYALIKRQLVTIEEQEKYRRFFFYSKEAMKDEKRTRLVTEILRAFQGETRKDGVHLVVFVYDKMSPFLLKACANAGVEAFDIQDMLPEVDMKSDWRQNSPLHFRPPVMHWNEEGNRWVAEGLFRYINMYVRPRPMLYY